MLGRCGSVERRDPDLAPFNEGHNVAPWGNDGLIAIADRFGIAAVEGHAEDLDLGRHRVRADVHRQRIVPIRAVIPAAHVDDPASIGGHGHAAQLLPVVAIVMRELARSEGWAFGHVDVAPALFVERPGDARAGRGRGQLGWVRVRTHLLERE